MHVAESKKGSPECVQKPYPVNKVVPKKGVEMGATRCRCFCEPATHLRSDQVPNDAKKDARATRPAQCREILQIRASTHKITPLHDSWRPNFFFPLLFGFVSCAKFLGDYSACWCFHGIALFFGGCFLDSSRCIAILRRRARSRIASGHGTITRLRGDSV